MVASKYTRPRSVAAPGAHPVGALVDHAADLVWRAPELALVLGERAAALAEAGGDDRGWLRAETLVVRSKVRLGDRAATVGRAVAALRAAEDAGDTVSSAGLRIDLSVCARSVGSPLAGLAALRPLLHSDDIGSADRASALAHLVGCMAEFGRRAELNRVLQEADRLYTADDSVDGDLTLVRRALVRVATSAHRRRHGDLVGAADAARTGLGLLEQLHNPAADGGATWARLVLQLVCTLLDRGEIEAAMEAAQPVLDTPLRAAGVAPISWLRLAIATRVHLPAGNGETACELVRDAVHEADRHGLSGLTSRLWSELGHIEEMLGRPADALRCVHRARAAEHIHARARRQACALLAGEFGSEAQRQHIDLGAILAAPAPQPQTTQTYPPRAAPVAPAPRPQPDPVVPPPGLRAAPEPPVAPEPREPVRTEPEPLPSWHLPASFERPEPPKPEEPKPAPEPATEVARDERPKPSGTRHDVEHGSVAASSVLDRLGIGTGFSGGGRRRAADPEDRETRAHREPPVPRVEPEPAPEPKPEPPAPKPADPIPEPSFSLPRLKLPPPLAPVEDVQALMSSPAPSGPDGKQADEPEAPVRTDPFADLDPGPPHYADAPTDDLPPDAGLADLLARALAEHRAGTSSASALVKRLGERQTGGETSRRVNGTRHGADGDAGGRHHGDQ